ncbi:glycosyltransferase family 2 protein [Paenibacillus crassostreae]|uniref:Glycosyltransferase 2-like domain-containing protein n=1 Tax=Paenibacillus crassostreae TaxID=1763538 RepID=A0A167GME3_9BACL|nr:glycosyltransferase family 2 protein [Paenibacillus crassostreae]AOZ92250.1 hypothetical protein LPB68_08445 [Paenibacillus crassostreae]OAB77713.1 hypothetical protein PNBC_01525 [Paenibacillus crassostreae]
MTHKTSIIILTHNQLPITQMCLSSIRCYTDEPYELIVVDNGSTDATVSYLKSQADVKSIFNNINLGFAKGCNQGIEVATGDTILFLNNDTIVTPNWLTAMLRVLYGDDDIGAVGPVTNYASGQQKIAVGYDDLTGLNAFAHEHGTRHAGYSFDVRRIIGFCMLFKRKIIEEVGGFDERYGLGNYEDDDMCLRVLNRGYRLRVVYDSYIHHFGHMTTKILQNANLGGLLVINREKAREKWGQDIHSLIYKDPVAITLVLPIDEHTVDHVKVILPQIQQMAEEIIVLDRGADASVLAKVLELTSKVVKSGTDTPEVWWSRIVTESTKKFLFWMNPAEHMSADERRKLSGIKLSLHDQVDAVSIQLQLEGGEPTTGGESSIVRRNRIVRRDAAFQWDDLNDEFLLESEGHVESSDILITY